MYAGVVTWLLGHAQVHYSTLHACSLSTLMYLKTLKSRSTLKALRTLIPAKPLLETLSTCKQMVLSAKLPALPAASCCSYNPGTQTGYEALNLKHFKQCNNPAFVN